MFAPGRFPCLAALSSGGNVGSSHGALFDQTLHTCLHLHPGTTESQGPSTLLLGMTLTRAVTSCLLTPKPVLKPQEETGIGMDSCKDHREKQEASVEQLEPLLRNLDIHIPALKFTM